MENYEIQPKDIIKLKEHSQEAIFNLWYKSEKEKGLKFVRIMSKDPISMKNMFYRNRPECQICFYTIA